MKKLIFVITIFFLMIISVQAKDDLIIEELKIKNAELSPKFDKYNNYYSVTITEDVKSLEFEYKFDQNAYGINITNNENLVENKLIYVTIYDKNSDEQNTYIFKIYKEETQTTANVVEEIEDKTSKNESQNYAPIIGTVCFILIIFVYYLIFLK